jgi:GT2 family glycosyltransferase
MTHLTHSLPRDDVYSAFRAPFARASGFHGQVDVTGARPGAHLVTLHIAFHSGAIVMVSRTVVVQPSAVAYLEIERAEWRGDMLAVSGFALLPGKRLPWMVSAYADGQLLGAAGAQLPRPDLGQRFPAFPGAAQSGFEIICSAPARQGDHPPSTLSLNIQCADADEQVVRQDILVTHRPDELISIPAQTAELPLELSTRERPIQEMLDGFAKSDPLNWVQRDRWYSENEPEVSIIIINRNKAELTVRCVKELWKRTTGRPYEIIVVDNGSQPDDFIKLTRFQGSDRGGVRVIRLNRNRYLLEGNNIGAESATGRYLFFLKNDTFVTPNWLDSIMGVFKDRDQVGAVGPTFRYPDGSPQRADCYVNVDGTVNVLGRNGDWDKSTFNAPREVDYCSAAGLMVRKDLFDESLGFDLCWEPAYYEDVDLCMKLKRRGYRVFYCPSATIVHIERFTSLGASDNIEVGKAVEINRRKFVARWKDNLSAHGTVFQRMTVESLAQESR